MSDARISDSELILMRIVWENGGTARYAVIADRLAEKGYDWKKNTVITFLARLQEKGMLTASKIGRRNEYTALLAEADYAADQTRHFLHRVYEGDARGLVATLLDREMISAEEMAELRGYWEKGESE